MSGLEIQTAQNVTLQYAPKSIGDRIGAFLSEINRETANMKPVLKVEKKIKDTLKITSSLPSLKFLYTIIEDHNYITTR